MESIKSKKIDYKSKSGSCYYFTTDGVFRLSNHWGRAANCKWRLQSIDINSSRTKLGYADWSDFHPDNETDRLYFIAVDFENQTVHYQHKNSPDYQNQFTVRTADETSKVIKNIRDLFANESWAKHFEYDDIAELRKKIIEKLVTTNQSLFEIKRMLPPNL
jgi:hypothetical protein